MANWITVTTVESNGEEAKEKRLVNLDLIQVISPDGFGRGGASLWLGEGLSIEVQESVDWLAERLLK